MSDEANASGIDAEDVAPVVDERDDITEEAAPEAADDATDAEAPDAEIDAEDGSESDDADESDEEADDDDEVIELNLGGKTVRFDKNQTAKDAAEAVQQFADETWRAHTARSEEIAATRKELQARSEAIDRLQAMDDHAFNLFTQAKQYDSAIANLEQQLGAIDRNANPDQYRFLSDDLNSYRAASEQARTALKTVEMQSSQEKQAHAQRLQTEGEAKVRKAVPKFDEKAVIDYVVTNYEGFDRQIAEATWAQNPAFAIMAHKAMERDNMHAAAGKAAQKSAPRKAKPVKPVARKGGPARRNLADMSPEEFHRVRLAQRRGG